MQEEEESLGVQYEMDSQHHALYPGSSSTVIAASSSSSVQMPVISQVSSSTENCGSSPSFLSSEALGPLGGSASVRMDASSEAAIGEEADVTVRGGSLEEFEREQEQQQRPKSQELASS